MYLKRLDVQGFKTFAQRTAFVFDQGITAIVGVNGSGKSNLTDAIRWVLGEQNLRLLRARRTEDVIFAGSATRAPVGMAEVVLTLDNADGALPVETAEVGVGRRLYRDGEGEYLINSRRVRHRDVVDLLVRANLGQNGFSIVSQGMVDAALSLRPGDRRALLEESTDIRRHQQRMAESQEKLQVTLANLSRVQDLLAELRPRMERLAEQADRARRHAELHGALVVALDEQYRREWRRAVAAHQAAVAQRDERRLVLGAREEDLRRSAAAQHATRSALAERQSALAEHRRALDTAREALARVDAEDALLAERRQSLTAGLAELSRERAWLEGEVAAAEQGRAAAAERIDLLAAEISRATAEAEQSAAGLGRLEAERQTLRREIAAQGKAAAAAERRVAALQEEIRQIERRRDEVAREAETRERREEERSAERGRLAGARAAVEGRLAEVACEVDQVAAELAAQRNAAQAAREQARTLEAEGQRLEVDRRHLAARLDVLGRLAQSREGFYPGVRAVLAAAARHQPALQGIVGVVAGLVQAPPDLDVALEVALGGHLQDVVVERWADAERAIEWLKRSGAGRATFLPLDTIRQLSPVRPAPADGVLGVASDLVQCDPAYRRVVEQLLGRTIVVRDLAVARRLLQAARSEQIVTLAGEVVRPQGWVTGGSLKAAEGGLLARERELRALPAQIERLEAELARLLGQTTAARGAEREATARAAQAEGRLRSLTTCRQQEQAEIDRLSRLIHRLDQETAWELDQAAAADRATAEIAGRLVALTADLAQAEAAHRTADAQSRAGEQRIEELAEAMDAARGGAAATRARAQALGVERSAERERLAQSERAIERLRSRQEVVAARAREETAALEATRVQAARIAQERLDWTRRRNEAEAAAEPLARAAVELAAQLDALAEQTEALRASVADAERQVQRATAHADRSAAELARLRDRALADGLEVDRLDAIDAIHGIHREEVADPTGATGRSLPALDGSPSVMPSRSESRADPDAPPPVMLSRSEASPRPEPAASGTCFAAAQHDNAPTSPLTHHSSLITHHSPGAARKGTGVSGHSPNGRQAGPASRPVASDAQIAAEVTRLRAALIDLGPVNPEAVAEHAEVAARCRFLEEQHSDLQQAERSLRGAIAQLDGLVKARFAETFGQLSQEFAAAFSRLFGGGRASLTLVQEDGEAGIDVLAQPPGKRPASLSALSGGERALTGIALLFALLAVNPAPFCVLDEVDAALDESNAQRFGQALRGLADRTQFLVVSHNRTTIERASILYGVTMGGDGVSRVLSLELDRAVELAERARSGGNS